MVILCLNYSGVRKIVSLEKYKIIEIYIFRLLTPWIE